MKAGACSFTNCTKHASYGPVGTNMRLYCIEHKSANMINTTNPLCIFCSTQATYGVSECRKITCAKHKLK